MRLVVAIETREQWSWLSAIDFATVGVTAVPFFSGNGTSTERDGRRIEHRNHASAPGLDLPSFGDVIEGLGEVRPDACLVSGDGPLSRLVTVGADLLGIAHFSLVETRDHLDNLGRRRKARPDLFFLADGELLPIALEDPRYGSTLLPTGHPAQDLALGDSDETSPLYRDERWGYGRAGDRILAAIAAWKAGRLDSSEPDLTVVVPAYREAANLPLVCDRLLAALDAAELEYEILLVDDASPDDTYRVALAQMWRSPRIRAVSKPLPRGMGNAIRYGLGKARAPVVAVTMGDGSDEVDRIPEMYRKIHDEGYALAIGSRYRHRRNYQTVPRIYRFWSFCFRWCTRLLIGFRLSDYTNAFRVFDRRIFSRYGPESGGFEISPEITFKAWFATQRVTEVDVRHLKRAAGQSSFSFLRAGPGYGKILTKALVQRMTGRWFTLDW